MDLAILEEVRAKAPELQNSSFAELLASLSNEQRNALLAELSPKEAESLNWNWQFWARPKQIAPSTDWRVWMIRAGRGFGKSRTGAEMVRQRVESGRCRRISLVARTASDIRDVMIEGQSGIMRISPPWNRPKYEPTKRRLTWPNGAVATTFSADQPDALRGPECDLAWCDELACLIAGTLVITDAGPRPIESIRRGDLVLTRRGLKRVRTAGLSGRDAALWEMTASDGSRLVGTYHHPIWSIEESAFVSLSKLQVGHRLLTCPMSLSGAESAGIGTRTITKTAAANSFIGSFTSTSMGRCLMAIMSITGTKTRKIGRSTTWWRSPFQSISRCIRAVLRLGRQHSSPLPELPNGKPRSQEDFVVSNATLSSNQQDSAPNSVAPPVNSAIFTSDIRVTSVRPLRLRAAVYNLEVDGEHEFFANGILTHNTWRYMEAWDNLMFGLRLGVNPQCVVTTTPRPIKVIRDLEKDPHCIVTTGSTLENSANLAPSFLSAILRKYEGTRLGRQEILAEILEDIAGAVFQRAWIDAGRRSPDNVGIKWPANKLGNKAPVKIRPEHMERMCVAIDPAMTSGEDSNETGIVVAGRDSNRHGYVFDDASGRMAPSEWVNTAVRLYNLWECDYIVAEVNNGGAMIANAIHQVDENIRVKEVIATRGKIVRAEPVGMVYEQGRGHHVGSFPELEDQMCRFTPDFIRKPEDSPDRMDALVWAFTDLIVEPIAGMGMFQYTKELAEEMAAQRGLRIIDGGLAA